MRCEGSYTVEATFVVTVCVWLIIAMCYTGCYVHDELILESECNGCAAKWIADGEKDRRTWEVQMKKKWQKKLFLIRISSVQAKKRLTGERITVRCSLPVSWKKLKSMLAGKDGILSYEFERENISAARYLWDSKKEGKDELGTDTGGNR